MLVTKSLTKCFSILGVSFIAVDSRAIGIVEGNPQAILTIDDHPMNLVVEPTESGWAVPPGTVVRTEDAQVTFTDGVQFNVDPSIAYGFAVIDFGAPSLFGFTFATPIAPTGPGTSVASTLAAGLTDFTDNGLALTPTGADLQINSASTGGIIGPYSNMGVDLGPARSEAGGGTGLPVGYVYGPYAEGLIPGPAGGPFDALKIELAFGLSGGGDVAALTGTASIIDAVPDGGAGFAGLAALATLAFIGSRKRA